jgi:hypothetical protein
MKKGTLFICAAKHRKSVSARELVQALDQLNNLICSVSGWKPQANQTVTGSYHCYYSFRKYLFFTPSFQLVNMTECVFFWEHFTLNQL